MLAVICALAGAGPPFAAKPKYRLSVTGARDPLTVGQIGLAKLNVIFVPDWVTDDSPAEPCPATTNTCAVPLPA